MQPSFQEYQAMNKRLSPGSPVLKDCVLAFLSGGLLCSLGQAVGMLAQQVCFPQ